MKILVVTVLFLFTLGACEGESGNYDSTNNQNNSNNDAGPDNDSVVLLCPEGTDLDNDGYGDGCQLGPDCNDENPNVNPGREEICNTIDDNCNDEIDEGVLNACGNCSAQCRDTTVGVDPFPLEQEDPNVDNEGTGRDENGDIVLQETDTNFYYLWTANTEDMGRGTVSKVDTRLVGEVGRYFTVTCFGRPTPYFQDGTCLDINGGQIQFTGNNPSRTAVDFNFDVWVANRAFGGQASVTKIASKLENCIDRNGDGIINTSADLNGDLHITVDCDGDGLPDDINTVCTNGLPGPEFLGLDDECVLLTTNFGENNQLGRNVCLDKGSQDIGASNVWVSTYNVSASNPQSATNNVYYQLDGMTGQFLNFVVLPPGIVSYGCSVDQDGMLWVSSWGQTTFIDTIDPNHHVGPAISVPSSYPSTNQMYGITIDDQGNIWFGGWGSGDIFRYRPNRTTYGSPTYYDDLAAGTWTRVDYTSNTAGIAADTRGYIWVADNNNGLILRLDQSIADGEYDASVLTVMNAGQPFGGTMRGVGLDFDGHVWGISHAASTATRLDLNASGDSTGVITVADVGANPYTYSDFTGYGLHNFTRPNGVYSIIFTACEGSSQPPEWHGVTWTSSEPTGTNIDLYVQTANDPQDLGSAMQIGPYDVSPASFTEAPGPIPLNPAWYIKVSFLLATDVKDLTPILHDFEVIYECPSDVPGK